MRWKFPTGVALALGLALAGPAVAQDAQDEPTDDIDLDDLLGDDDPAEAKPEAEATPEPEATPKPEPTDAEKADKESLSLVSYEARAHFDSQYFGHTLVRAERHLGHVDVFFITQDGKKMMAEVRPDGSLGKVEKASF